MGGRVGGRRRRSASVSPTDGLLLRPSRANGGPWKGSSILPPLSKTNLATHLGRPSRQAVQVTALVCGYATAPIHSQVLFHGVPRDPVHPKRLPGQLERPGGFSWGFTTDSHDMGC